MVPRRSEGIAKFISDPSASQDSKPLNEENVTKLSHYIHQLTYQILTYDYLTIS